MLAYCLTVLYSAVQASPGSQEHRDLPVSQLIPIGAQGGGGMTAMLDSGEVPVFYKPVACLPESTQSSETCLMFMCSTCSLAKVCDLVPPQKHTSWQYRGQPRQREWHPIRLAADSSRPVSLCVVIVCSFVASGLGLSRIGALPACVGGAAAEAFLFRASFGSDQMPRRYVTWLALGRHIITL